MFQSPDRAEEAMNFYVSILPNSRIVDIKRYGPGEPGVEGSVMLATFEIAGETVLCIDSPISHDFTFTPSLSLYVECESEDQIDHLYSALASGGELLMPLDPYGFSRKFGWLNDRYGVSWQLNLPNGRAE
jgi:predicted 3-demethylubiquinone-9 3-methyltransferase (glyoxalase superfamily)